MTNIDENTSCSSSTDLVAYLYDELNPTDRIRFESHLAGCGNCTDEFAELSFARLDVYEWHRDEFAPLPTPRFVIPFAKTEAGLSRFNAVRAFFASNRQWATAGGALVLAAVVFGAVYFSTIATQTNEIADAIQKADDAKITIDQPEVKSTIVSPIEIKSADAPAKDSSQPQVVRTLSGSKAARPFNRGQVKKAEIKMPSTAQKAKPRLNDFADEDDNTLRLGDLLADVDTRD